jgi:malate dehydrogenase (oxaloacetate-decarboxylating)
MVGAGAAGMGIARLLRAALLRAGLQGDDLMRSLALVDVDGLVVDSDLEYRRGLSWPAALAESCGLREGNRDLLAVVGALKPTALLGASGAPGLFTEAVVREMGRHVERPLIFPLSNPTSRSEAIPSDLLRWTEGKALIATGSPFGSVELGGRTVRIGQGNNVYVFPGVGLGALVAEAREITDTMFAAAGEALAAELSEAESREGVLYPAMGRLRQVTARVAAAVVREARERGLGRPLTDAEIPGAVAAAMWESLYPELEVV